MTSQASGQDQWSPFSFESAKVDLEQAHMDMVERVVKQAAATNASADVAQGTAAGTQGAAAKAAKLQEELMAMLSTLTPATYLQVCWGSGTQCGRVWVLVLRAWTEPIQGSQASTVRAVSGFGLQAWAALRGVWLGKFAELLQAVS